MWRFFMKKKDVRKYLRQVRFCLPLHTRVERKYLQELRETIIEYQHEHNDISMPDIVKHFGTPKDVAIDYLTIMDEEKLYRLVSIRRILRIVLTAALILILSCFILFNVYLHHMYLLDKEAMAVSEETIIVEGDGSE